MERSEAKLGDLCTAGNHGERVAGDGRPVGRIDEEIGLRQSSEIPTVAMAITLCGIDGAMKALERGSSQVENSMQGRVANSARPSPK